MRTERARRDVEGLAVDAEDQRIVLYGISFDEYVALNDVFVDRSGPRFSYLDGVLEMMTTGLIHESLNAAIRRLFERYALSRGTQLHSYGRTTQRKRKKSAAIEPDECYFVGPKNGRRFFDKMYPDIAIEVVVSHAMRKLEIYRRLGVREVWVFEKGRFTIHALVGRKYVEQAQSQFFPELNFAELAKYALMEDQGAAVEAYWARLNRKRRR